MYWDEKYECMERSRLEQLQLERLQATLTRVSRNVPFYRAAFEANDVDPDNFLSLDDLKRLPFTTKADLRENYPYGLFAVPLRDVVRLHSSSGTTGKPTVIGYTANDIKRWTDLAARVLTAGGVGRDDMVQIAFGYGLFTGGFGFHYGAEKAGASVIPSSSAGARRQIMIMQDYRTTALICTPSYALYLSDVLEEMGLSPTALTLKYGLFGAETWTEGMRREIQERLGITATDNYGVSEVMGPGLAGECLERKGMHVNEDHFLVEVLDPATLEPVPEGETGELVITTLTKEAFPLIRFRTGDLSRMIPDPCPCGRTFQRLDRILGRTDDMFIIKGVNVFPSQVEAVLLDEEDVDPHYQIIVEREGRLDKATVLVEAREEILVDRISASQQLIKRIKKRLSSETGVEMEVRLVESKTLERTQNKTRRVIDKRSF